MYHKVINRRCTHRAINRVMYHLKDGLERVFLKEELMLIPKDTELLPDYVQNGDTSKNEPLNPRTFQAGQGSVWVNPKVAISAK